MLGDTSSNNYQGILTQNLCNFKIVSLAYFSVWMFLFYLFIFPLFLCVHLYLAEVTATRVSRLVLCKHHSQRRHRHGPGERGSRTGQM